MLMFKLLSCFQKMVSDCAPCHMGKIMTLFLLRNNICSTVLGLSRFLCLEMSVFGENSLTSYRGGRDAQVSHSKSWIYAPCPPPVLKGSSGVCTSAVPPAVMAALQDSAPTVSK